MSFSEIRSWISRYANMMFFVGGFLFDAFALQRIDSVLDLVIQSVYLFVIAMIVVYQEKEKRGHWHPGHWFGKLWHHNVEALHFIYGSLLSAYVIFYFKSSTFSRSAFFLLLVVVLMFVNEMPQLRRYGSRMRLGLYALCIVSFLNYLLPVLIGRMGDWVFAAAVVLSAGICWYLVKRLAAFQHDPARSRWNLGWAPALVLSVVVVFYANKWIPPVPLSMKYAGIYHMVGKRADQYELSYTKWPWYQFWRRDDRPFLARPGDSVICFVRVFGPRRFRNQIYLHWSEQAPDGKRWITSDRIPLGLYGGRGEGFRGYATKSNYQPGRWRVDIETEDGRPLGEVVFEIRSDGETAERLWSTRYM